MDFEKTNIQKLQELKSGLLKKSDKIQRLEIFAKGDKVGIEKLEEIENMSTEDTIGANYYLAQYLSQYLNGRKMDENQTNYTDKQNKLEKEFMEQFLPFISKQGIEINNFYSELCYYPNYGAGAFRNKSKIIETFDQSLKSIVDKLADISFNKIANKQQISEKDYGIILTKIALFIGDFVNIAEYNMLYLGLYHELSQDKDYGTYAEKYLKEMVLKQGLVDSRFYPEDENRSKKK